MNRFEDHLNMLIKMTKIANPQMIVGSMQMMRRRLRDMSEAQIVAIRPQITIATWGSQENVDWQMTFLDRCQGCIDQTFLEHSPRWQIGYVEIA